MAGEEATQNSSYVAVECWGGSAECDAGNGAGGVVTDSGEESKFVWIGGKLTTGE